MTAQPDPFRPPADDDLGAIYDRYYSRVHRFALRRFGPRDAEDIAQETLARCYANADRIDRARDLWPWLCTVAHNVGCDIARVRARDVAVTDEALDTLRGPAEHDAAHEVVAREERRMLRQALDRLSPADRLILRMREVEELGFDAIGEFLGMTANNARQRVFRARLRLGKIYAELDGRVRAILVALVGGRAWLRRRATNGSARTQELAPLFNSPVACCLAWATTVAIGAGVAGGSADGLFGGGRGGGARDPLRSGAALLAAGWRPRDVVAAPQPGPGSAPGGRVKVVVREGGDGTRRVRAEAGPARFESRVRDPRRRDEVGETDRSRLEVDTPLGTFYVGTGGENPTGGPGTLCIATGVCLEDRV